MKNRIPTIVSVDWDYFLPFCTDRRYDWGHSEGNPVMYEIMWHARAMPWPEGMKINGHPIPQNNVVDEVKVNAAQVAAFWNTVLASGSPRKVCIQDSHGKLPDFLTQWRGKVNVINFDAHHDCGYQNEDPNEPTCANWAHYLKESGKLNHYTSAVE